MPEAITPITWKTGSLLVLFIFVLNLSCKENPIESVQTFVPKITDLIAPGVIYTLSPIKHLISVKVDDPQGVEDIRTVSYEIRKAGTSVAAAAGSLEDSGELGDIIPNDGIFTTQIDGGFARNDSGEFNVQVTAVDKSGNTSETLTTTIGVLSGTGNSIPVILRTSVPQSVVVDPAFEFIVEIEVTDVDGLADVKKVSYQFFPPAHPRPTLEGELQDDGQFGDRTPNDGTFAHVFSTSLFQEVADYFLRFQVEDFAGNKSAAAVASIRTRTDLLSEPVISNLVAPAIVILNGEQNPEIVVSVDVLDPQGLSDIDHVQLRVFLPDGRENAHGPFRMADDGNVVVSGDTTAGDGTYSSKFQFSTSEMLTGEFRFLFQAKDKGNFLSNKIEYSLPVTLNDAPVITNLVAPAQVAIVDMQDTVIVNRVDVADPQGLSDIETVQFRVFEPGGEESENSPVQMADDGDVVSSGDLTAGDGTYSGKFAFEAMDVAPGEFVFAFDAKDKSDSLSNEIRHVVSVAFINSPIISNVMAPDTVKIDPNKVTEILITVDAMDPEGLSDLDFVRFRSFLPSGSEAQGSPLELVDDGNTAVSGDVTAGDGTFSIIINLPPTGVTPGDFRFVFQAKDNSELLSNIIEHIMTVTE